MLLVFYHSSCLNFSLLNRTNDTNLAEWVPTARDQRRATMHLGTAVLGLSMKSLALADEWLANMPVHSKRNMIYVYSHKLINR